MELIAFSLWCRNQLHRQTCGLFRMWAQACGVFGLSLHEVSQKWFILFCHVYVFFFPQYFKASIIIEIHHTLSHLDQAKNCMQKFRNTLSGGSDSGPSNSQTHKMLKHLLLSCTRVINCLSLNNGNISSGACVMYLTGPFVSRQDTPFWLSACGFGVLTL